MFMFRPEEIFGYSSPSGEYTTAKLSSNDPKTATPQRKESLVDKPNLLQMCESSGLCHWWSGIWDV